MDTVMSKTQTKHADVKDMTFERALKELESIVTRLEKGDVFCRPRQRQALLHWAYDSRKI